ncbi:MAG: hypothetical protein HQM13_17160 [SAR324 cluster bacterium]|nr:hypothetical protein [SAR324 cluster bacterium]
MKKNRFGASPIGLDSLVDIVSNNVGILVILTVFMALISLLDPPEYIQEEKKDDLLTTKKIIIPWAHFSQKSSLLFLIRDNHLLYFDRSLVYQQLKSELKYTDKPESQFEFSEYSVDLLVESSNWHCLDFHPKPQAGEWWHQVKSLDLLTSQYSPSEFYFFFWVDSNSFDLFREVRDYLREKNFESGWKPVLKKSALQYCTDASRFLNFQPQ